MTILKRGASMVSALVMMISGAGAYNCSAEGTTVNDSNTNNTREIVIDGTTAQLKENMRYRGAGMVSAELLAGVAVEIGRASCRERVLRLV